ncbi:thiol reductase thioredoxin [Cytophagales bacterium WSM2-2]|nr:thiol reductase thioredoxin [Cytophagales bacterium WSM2-2]
MESEHKTRKFSDILKEEHLVLVEFSAAWCGPCKMMVPVLAELKSWIGEKVTILKIDVDKNARTAANYEIRSVPTLLLFKNGQVTWRHSGTADLHMLKRVLQQHFTPG